jgi:hypothetical protein
MKLRILNYRVSATHDLISNLGSIRDTKSISDFHAFVYDSSYLRSEPGGYTSSDIMRHQAEVRDLIHKEGWNSHLYPETRGCW